MQKNINGILMRTVVVLLVLVCLSTAMVTGRYARYYSTATASDSARVAKFEVNIPDLETQLLSVTIQPNETVKQYITVKNKSEVAVALTISVSSKYRNLPLVLKYPEYVPVPPRESKDVLLEVSWPVENSEDKYAEKYAGKVDLLEISVLAEQID